MYSLTVIILSHSYFDGWSCIKACVIDRLPYAAIFGGVAALKKEHFQLVNGFSNQFFGWGGEDDDLYNRFV